MLNTTLIPETSRSISPYAKRQLALALKANYLVPVTGFLVDAFVIANAAVGISYQHARRESTGRFADGHLLRTSDIGYLQAARWTPLAYGTSALDEVEHCHDVQTASLDAVLNTASNTL